MEELLDNITDDSIAGEILDAILAYEDLTTEEQAALGRDRQIEDLKKRAAELNQTRPYHGYLCIWCGLEYPACDR